MWGRMSGRMLGPMWGQFHSSEKIIKRSRADNLVISCKYSVYKGRVKYKQLISIQKEIILNDSL